MEHQTTTADRRMARIAGRAWGVATRRELLAAGITRPQIRRRIDRGSLVVVFPGVYRVGHAAPSTEATYIAAVKACGKEAGLSGAAAAFHLGLIKGQPPPPEVTAPTKKRIKGIKTNRNKLHPSERTTFRRIPCTTPARTLVDLAATLDPATLSRAVHEAQVRFKVTPARINQVIARHPNAPGVTELKAILTGKTPITLSDLEEAFIKLLKKHKLPLPITNRRASGRSVDCRWPEHKLTVELDSYTFHNSRHAWESDHAREREAYARGDEHFRRYTYRDVCEEPAQMLRELRMLLP